MGSDKISDEYLHKLGIDAHAVKHAFGCEPFGEYDLYNNGKTVEIKSKFNSSKNKDTEMTKSDLAECFPDKNKKREMR